MTYCNSGEFSFRVELDRNKLFATFEKNHNWKTTRMYLIVVNMRVGFVLRSAETISNTLCNAYKSLSGLRGVVRLSLDNAFITQHIARTLNPIYIHEKSHNQKQMCEIRINTVEIIFLS